MRSAEEILTGLDYLFSKQRMSEVEPYLQQALQEAMEGGDSSTVITIVNELIGFYRDTSQYEKSVFYCEQILGFMEMRGLKGSIHYATTCLNVANAYRAAGEWSASLKYYEEVKHIYDRMLTPTDSLYASYFNNLSLLYQEMGEFEKAVQCLKTALVIMEAYGDIIKVAITCSNLATSLLRVGAQQEAEYYLNRALQIFIDDGEQDFHYGAALSAMGELQFRKQQYEDSKKYYQKALAELEKHVGKTEYYYRTLDNLEQVENILARQNNNCIHEEVMLKNNKESLKSDNNKNCMDSNDIRDRNQKESLEINDMCSYQQKDDRKDNRIDKTLGQQMFEDFYYEYGEPMLQKKFPAFIDKIAIGKTGEGSDCFGFDDEISLDHDFGPGFCMWVTKDTYDKIGDFLRTEYEKLPTSYRGVNRRNMENGKGRVGVCIIEDFYKRILGMEKAPETIGEWSQIEEFALAAATNGWILRDEEGIFTEIRNKLLAYYPDELWLSKIAQSLYSISQYGQYNYGRMARRTDVVTAEQCRSRFIKSVMELIYLLNRTYAPYYKWMFRGMERLDDFGLSEKLSQLVLIPIMNIEENESFMEHICVLVLEQMEKKGFLIRNPHTTYLEHYIGQVLNYTARNYGNKAEDSAAKNIKKVNEGSMEVNDADIVRKNVVDNITKTEMANGKENSSETEKPRTHGMDVANHKKKLVDLLVRLEWQNFDQVKNEGGRADCQDDWGTFSIMRTSQYLTWTEEMLESYIYDFKSAMSKGWNLITEKYGRMMESTAPKRFEKIKAQFPFLAEEKKAIIEEIVKIQVAWMEEFALEFPYMAGNSRVIHTSEDTLFSTSFETYLRGELGTYSDKTLDLYGRFIVSYLQAGKNLTKDIMTNTALLYGYASLEKAEELLTQQD